VESPLGGDWSYALNDGGFQTTPLFTDIFPGNHILIVRNTSGDRDTVSFNANCGLEPFACGDCDASDGFYQVFGLEGELAALDLDEQEFKLLPNSPAGYGLNAMGINPLDSLAYGIRRSSPPELIVVDKSGRDVSLGSIDMLPNRVYHAGDFDSEGYLHIKDNQTNRQVFAIDVKKSRVERAYSLSSNLYSADFAYNPIDGLFYGLNGSGQLYSFDPNSGLYSNISNTSMRRSFGAVYSDNAGRVWGIENATGNLYEVDLSSGDLTLVMTTTNSSRNDGFSCQNSYFNHPGPTIAASECSSLPGQVNLRIVEPVGENLEFSLNGGNFQSDPFFEGISPGNYEIITRYPGSCSPDTTSINLEAQFNTTATIETNACDSFIIATGEIWFDSGTYQDTISNSMGCDSIISYDITILNSSESFQVEEVNCADYEWNGMTLDSSGVYEFLTTNSVGCDSLARLDLTIVREVDTSFSASSCQSYSSPDGQEIWTSSGQYTDTLISSEGCDSIINIDLTILESTSSTQFAEACLTYSWKGRILDSSGVYEFLTTNAAGCDSLVQLDLNIVTEVDTSFSASTCQSYSSPDGQEIWTSSGQYTDTLISAEGCDSIINIDLTILESTSSTQFAEACLTYSWKGRTLDSSGVYEFLATNAAGCDSLVQLDLNIVTEVDTSFSAVSCRPYPSPDGEESWTGSGMYTDTLLTDQGCDSIITIDLWIGDIQANWQLFDPTCPDQLTTDLQIDSLSYSAPFLMIRNQLDTIVISDFPTRISDFPEGPNSFVFLSSDSCSSEEFTIDIERLQEPEIRILGPSEVGVCDPATSFRLETSMPGEVQWSAPASLSCDTCLTTSLNPDSSGTIRVEFIADNECVATEAFFVQVNGIGDVQYFIPNVFSPNGDGINDYFTMFTGHGEVDQVELFEIYDRWGNRLFQRKNFFPSHESLGWDGSYQGSPLSPGVYVYHILYRYCDGSTHRIHGSVTLVR
jgi:gliding motility-associated-like protein